MKTIANIQNQMYYQTKCQTKLIFQKMLPKVKNLWKNHCHLFKIQTYKKALLKILQG